MTRDAENGEAHVCSPKSGPEEDQTGYFVSLHTEDDGYMSRQQLVVERDGKVVRTEYDGGEPEDQSFYRDWSWVTEALKEAYAFGLEDGRGRASDKP